MSWKEAIPHGNLRERERVCVWTKAIWMDSRFGALISVRLDYFCIQAILEKGFEQKTLLLITWIIRFLRCIF